MATMGTSSAGSSDIGDIIVAPGYKVVKIASGVVPTGFGPNGLLMFPSAMDFGCNGEIYVTSLDGRVVVVVPWKKKVRTIVPAGKLEGSMGVAVHPHTGMLYVSSRYWIVKPSDGGNPLDPDNQKSKISIVHPYSGHIRTFVDGLPSLTFPELIGPITGAQNMQFDSAGNLYVAQGINDLSEQAGDPHQSAILKIDRRGKVSVYATGLRSPYDVCIGREDCYGRAAYLYAGDNGEGAINNNNDEATSQQYYDELNRVIKGKHYGWPGGSYVPEPGRGEAADPEEWFPTKTNIGPLWNFEVNPPNKNFPENSWPVPTGIDCLPRGHDDVVFLSMFNCPSFFVPNLGTIEMFFGMDCSERVVLAKQVDGPIDVRLHPSGKAVYFIEFQTADIYCLTPYGNSWTPKQKHAYGK